MRSFILTTTVLLAASTAFAYKPTVEREFDDVALHGCSNHDADFMVRGMVSAATERPWCSPTRVTREARYR